uniref:Uncharacterized protein n=1 Tax=Panagrolaimus sp. ES5 TaxID=591445 RepID=A0AC34FGP1_9BILA
MISGRVGRLRREFENGQRSSYQSLHGGETHNVLWTGTRGGSRRMAEIENGQRSSYQSLHGGETHNVLWTGTRGGSRRMAEMSDSGRRTRMNNPSSTDSIPGRRLRRANSNSEVQSVSREDSDLTTSSNQTLTTHSDSTTATELRKYFLENGGDIQMMMQTSSVSVIHHQQKSDMTAMDNRTRRSSGILDGTQSYRSHSQGNDTTLRNYMDSSRHHTLSNSHVEYDRNLGHSYQETNARPTFNLPSLSNPAIRYLADTMVEALSLDIAEQLKNANKQRMKNMPD